ncbi:DUF120 domain-containing protein [Aliiruegeria haliotis]|nr:DUF120 domain-containing protein [Aliiruegeria haliotis]
MRLEILDNRRERRSLNLGSPADRIHIVVEVADIESARDAVSIEAPGIVTVSWGARLFQLRDPDGVAVTYLEWLRPSSSQWRHMRGGIQSGHGRGQYFTQLDWARAQFVEKLGMDPFPGTLNLMVEDDLDSTSNWLNLRGTPGIRIENPHDGPRDCDARCYPVLIDGRVSGAIVLPEVPQYPRLQIELIAPARLRDLLKKSDGDFVDIEVLDPSENKFSKEERTDA